MSVRRMLYLVSFLMTLIPLVLFAWYEYSQLNERIIVNRRDMLTEFAYLHSSSLLDSANSFESEVAMLGETLDIDSAAANGNMLSENLSGAVNLIKETEGLVIRYMLVADERGQIIAANEDLITGMILPDYLVTLKHAGVYLSGFKDNEYGLWVSASLENGLTLLAFKPIESYAGRLARLSVQETVYAFITDSSGTIVFHSAGGYTGETIAGSSEYFDGSGSGESDMFGNWQIYGFNAVHELGCIVYVVQDKQDVLSTNRNFILDAIIIAAMFTAISMAIVVPVLHAKIIKPISELKKSMSSFGGGGFVICDIQMDNELGELIDGYNQMAEQLKDHLDSLRHTNEALLEAEERLKLDKEKLKASEQRFKSATELSTIAIFELVTYTNEFYCSESWEAITTYKPQSIYPLDYMLRNIIHPDYRASITDWFDKVDTRYDDDLRIVTSNGSLKWVHLTMAAVDDPDTGIKKISGTITDIDERMVAMELTNYVAYHESLTGFARRVLYVGDISKRLPLLDANTWGAVIILSLENIRRINDIFGFDIGDQIIIMIAAGLKERFGEKMYYARNSGNSFLMFCECPRDISYIGEICDQMLEMFANPLQAGDMEMSVLVKAHIGVALYPDHGDTVEALIQNADVAMHEARYVRKSDSAIFDPVMLAKIRRTHQIIEVLRDFEANKALYIQYQPIIDMSRKCVGFEALVRMDISPIGYISPAEFIPLAEESKMIIPIGKAILKNSCIKAVELLNKGYDFSYMSVNVSAVQLEDGEFVDMVHHVLAETGMPYEKLQIEVTESIMISDVNVASEKLGSLRKKGVKIALDDFGTGYSSMKYLRVIPLDVIKIDKHFIDEINNSKQQLFAFTMIQMAHEIGLKVVAEGVETELQFDLLKERKCDSIQGYYMSRPLFENAIEDFLKEH